MEVKQAHDVEQYIFSRWIEEELKPREGIHLSDLDLCLAPQTRVLKADLTWCPLGDIKVGDSLIGIDEHILAPKGRRKMRESRVLSVRRRIAEGCFKVVASNGIEVIATPEHLWLTSARTQSVTGWRSTDKLVPTHGGSSQLAYALTPWDTDLSWEAGYLAAAFDGEGHVSNLPTSSPQIGFAQRPNEMLETTRTLLGQKRCSEDCT